VLPTSLQRQRKWYEDRTSRDRQSRQDIAIEMNNSDETEAARTAHSERESTQSQIELQCGFCGCSTKEDVIRAALWTNRGLVVIEDIPVRLCEGCGEQFFEEEITQRIREVLTYPGAKTKRQIRVPVYSMSGVGVANKGRHSQAAGRPHAVPSDATQQQGEQASERVSADQSCQESFHCKYCKSETVEGLVKSALWVDGRLLAIEDIPARVCQQCKERHVEMLEPLLQPPRELAFVPLSDTGTCGAPQVRCR
jgi:YgiT-type zinc finger domain-containing protein